MLQEGYKANWKQLVVSQTHDEPEPTVKHEQSRIDRSAARVFDAKVF